MQILHDHDFILNKSAEQILVKDRRQKGQVLSLVNHVMSKTITESPYNPVAIAHAEPVLKVQIVGVEVVCQ
jgi:hypothetical protein